MDKDEDAKLREHAYRLWEEEGRPEGRAKTHWDMAREALGGAPLPAAGTMSEPGQSAHAIEPAKKPKTSSKTKEAAKPAPKPKSRKSK